MNDATTGVGLYWLPLGAGGHCVRLNGRAFEAVVARHEHRAACDLYHSALQVDLRGSLHVIEMAPVWNTPDPGSGATLASRPGETWHYANANFVLAGLVVESVSG